jgi:peptidoglycan/xylan/chitin deacetylase (PgdA/CDA1 family)
MALRESFKALEAEVLASPSSKTETPGAILMYHRVATLSPDVAGLCMPPELFRAQMEHIAHTYEPVHLGALTGESALPRRAVAITFDDGYLDTFAASDILRGLGMPATFFVNSHAGGETFLDSLSRVFLEGNDTPQQLELSVPGVSLSASCGNVIGRRAAFDTLREIGYQLPADVRRELLFALYRWSGLDPAPRTSHRMLTPGELRELADRPKHSIGAHTENHLWLPAQPHSVRIREIAINRRYLQDVLGQEICDFAYPYGAYDQETVGICRSVGFRFGVTVMPGPVRPWNDPLLLPRIEVRPQTADSFAVMMESLWN